MKKYNEIPTEATPGLRTGMLEFDEFISADGGIYSGHLIFMTGTSGAGKTTFGKLLQKGFANVKSALYEAETSAKALSRQLRNIKIHNNAYVVDSGEMNFTAFMEDVDKNGVKIVLIDSLQMAAQEFVEKGMSGKEASMKVFNILKKWKESTDGIVILIGQVTKDDTFAGTNEIKHMADTHLELIHVEATGVRYMKTGKNRMGGSSGKLYYTFVKDERVFAFSNVPTIDKSVKFVDILFNGVKMLLQKYENETDNNSKLFIQECANHIRSINEEEDNDMTAIQRIITVVNELLIKYDLQDNN